MFPRGLFFAWVCARISILKWEGQEHRWSCMDVCLSKIYFCFNNGMCISKYSPAKQVTTEAG